FLLARTADNLAAGSAHRRARSCRPLEVADRAAHPHRLAPADRDVGLMQPSARPAKAGTQQLTAAWNCPTGFPLPGERAAKRSKASKRDGDAVERRVAIDEIDAFPGAHDAAVRLHQPVQRGAREYPLLLAAIFNHHEF